MEGAVEDDGLVLGRTSLTCMVRCGGSDDVFFGWLPTWFALSWHAHLPFAAYHAHGSLSPTLRSLSACPQLLAVARLATGERATIKAGGHACPSSVRSSVVTRRRGAGAPERQRTGRRWEGLEYPGWRVVRRAAWLELDTEEERG
jgi:hypothetical protein